MTTWTGGNWDKAAPDNPIGLSMGIPILNMALVNSLAIEALWDKYGDFVETYGRYWVDASGRPDGHLEPPAVRTLVQTFMPEPDVELMAPLYKKALEERAALGVTTMSGVSMNSPWMSINGWTPRGEMPLRYGYGVAWDVWDARYGHEAVRNGRRHRHGVDHFDESPGD